MLLHGGKLMSKETESVHQYGCLYDVTLMSHLPLSLVFAVNMITI